MSLPSQSSEDDSYSLDQCAHQPPYLVSPPFLLGLGCYKVGTLGPEHPKNNDIRGYFRFRQSKLTKEKGMTDGTVR